MLFAFLLLWLLLLNVPAVVLVPQMEASWLGFGEIAVMLAGIWIRFAANARLQPWRVLKFATGANGIRWARRLFIVSLPMIGLSHFVYATETAAYVPHWLPFPLGWACLTGAGSLAACLGLLRRVAAACGNDGSGDARRDHRAGLDARPVRPAAGSDAMDGIPDFRSDRLRRLDRGRLLSRNEVACARRVDVNGITPPECSAPPSRTLPAAG
ncbi:MAG TPA: hypothetical protein VGC55_14740 [Dokdonella sp.]